MKLSILVPVFNEGPTVSELLRRVWQQALPEGMEKELVIVESNSTDGSRQLVERFVSEANSQAIKLILQDRPRGKGHAVREAMAKASGDIFLIQDADLEYSTEDYGAILMPILEDHTDFVLGSRHMAAGHWRIRKFHQSFMTHYFNIGGSLFHSFFNVVYGVKLTDPTTMFKAFKASCVKDVEFESDRFDFDFELVAKLIRMGFLPLEVPVSYFSRGFEDGKKVSVWRDPFTWVVAILKFRFKPIRRKSGV